MKKYDVILTCNYSPWSRYSGGGQKSTHIVATELAEQGLAVCVVYSKSFFEKISVPDLLYDVKWTLFVAVKPGVSSPLRFLNSIFYYLKLKKLSVASTVIHSNGDEGALLGLLPNKKKFVYTNRCPNFQSFMYQINWSKITGWIKVFVKEPRYAAMAGAIRSADEVTCTSNYSVLQVSECFDISKEKIHLIYNGIDQLFLESPLTNIERSQSDIVYYGRLAESKGVLELLQGWLKLSPEQKKSHKLVIIGQGPLKVQLQKLITDENVEFVEWAFGELLIQRINQASLVVLPSREESFGNTMLETLALGKRLLTTSEGSLGEVLGEYAGDITSVNAESIHAVIADNLNNTISSERQQVQRDFVNKNYSWKRTVLQFLTLYSK